MAINNTVELTGNMSKSGARIIETEENTFAVFSLATTDSYKSKDTNEWIDKDTIMVGRDFGEGTTTDSGYPAEARILKRGQSIEEAKMVFKGEKTDVAAGGSHVFRP